MPRIITEQEYEALNTLLLWTKEALNERANEKFFLHADRERAAETMREWRYTWKAARRGVVKIGRTLSPTNPEKQAR